MWKLGKLPSLGLLVVLLASCESDPAPGKTDSGKEPSITSFTASNASILRGDAVTLSWATKDAASVRLFAGSSTVQLGNASAAAGSVEVEPRQTTVFRLEARGANGSTVSGETTVVVIQPVAPTIQQFSATPLQLGAGAPVTLTWKTTDASSLTISDDEGRPVDLSSASPLEGSVSVVPVVGTTYVLTASGPGGRVTARTSIEIVPRPVASLFADKLRIPAGTTATLSWQTSGATEARVFAEGAEEPTSEGVSGSLEVAPARTTVYSVEATGPGGTIRANRTISVLPVIDVFVSSATEAVRPGMAVGLSWSIRGGTSATISNLGGWSYEIPADQMAGGSVMARVGTGGVFTIQARDGDVESDLKSINVRLTGEPRILSAIVEPASGVTAGRGERAKVQLSWVVDGAEGALQLEKIPGGPVGLVTRSNRRDQIEIEVSEPTELRLTAINAAGRHQITVPAPVVVPAEITSLRALPNRVGHGETVGIHWTTVDAVSVTLERDGALLGVAPSQLNGRFDEMLATEGRYTLRAYNELGFEVASDELVVTVGAPLIHSFTVNQGLMHPGAALHFAWENQGGTSLKVIERDEHGVKREVCSELDFDLIEKGSCNISAPQAVGAYNYELRVSNGDGDAREELEAWVTRGPTLITFAADPTLMTEGDSVHFSWTVAKGLDDQLPSLQLVDQNAKSYDLSGADPLNGQKTQRLSTPGDYVFTLISPSGDAAPPSRQSVAVKVLGLPIVTSFTASPAYVMSDGDPTTLSWTTQLGASLEIFALDRAGVVRGGAVCATTTQVDGGTCTVRPTKELPDFRMRIRNPLGALREVDLRVGVQPATVVSFTADAYDILEGESTTLRWETARATSVQLGPVFEEISEPFIDAVKDPNGTTAWPTANSSGTFEFPDGFTFPYFGKTVTKAHITACGSLTFNATTGPSCTTGSFFYFYNSSFPSGSNLQLAPFFSGYIKADSPSRRESAIWQVLRTDPVSGRRSLVIQWSNWVSAQTEKGTLNFEVVLHDDGIIDYRYGEMRNSAYQSQVDGQDAYIGYQSGSFASPNLGHVISSMVPVPGGLSNRSFRMNPALARYAGPVAAVGSKSVTPDASFGIRLVADNEHSHHEKALRVNVHKPVALSAVGIDPAAPLPNQPFAVTWQGVGIGSLTVKDEHNETLWSSADPAVIASGRHMLPSGLPRGDHTLTFHAVSPVGPRNQTSTTLSIAIYEPFSIESFVGDKTTLELGESAVLSWSGVGLETVEILASSGPVVVLPPGVNPNLGSVTVSPSKTTTYTLVGWSYGRRKELPLTINVPRSARVDSVSASKTSIFAGEDVSISWSTSAGGQVSITESTYEYGAYRNFPAMPMTEVSSDPTKLYRDISAEGATELTTIRTGPPYNYYQDFNFPSGFTFPWFGEEKSSIRVMRDGLISWKQATSETNRVPSSKYPTGNSLGGDENRAFVVFGQTFGTTKGSAWWKVDPSGDFLTIQWKDWESNPGGGSYNFQLVLFRDGTFEYRYGEMTNTTVPGDANGGSANIGWQGPNAKIGTSLTFKTPVPGGLANRSWRGTQVPANGSFTFSPSKTQTIEVCKSDGAWRECQSVRINVVQVASIAITEVMVLPTGGPGAQWFEVRNLTDFDIDMRGMTIHSQQGGVTKTHLIAASEPVLLPRAGGYKVFSANPIPGVASYVYGTASGIVMQSSGYDIWLALTYGGEDFAGADLSELQDYWVAGKSMELSGHRHSLHLDDWGWNDPWSSRFFYWCVPTKQFDGTNYGTPGATGGSCNPFWEAPSVYDVETYSSMPFIDVRTTKDFFEIPALKVASTYAQIPGGVPFDFNFFGTQMSTGQTLWASSNGFALFASLNDSYGWPKGTFAQYGSNPKGGIIAPFWAKLAPGPNASFTYNSGTIDQKKVLALQWSDYRVEGTTGSITFQLQLWGNGEIVLAFKDLAGGPESLGSPALIGIESVSGEQGVEYLNRTPALIPNQSILFKKK